MTKRFITLDELSVYLGISKGTLYNWSSQGRLPGCCKISRLLRFDIEKIDRWMKDQEKPINDKIM